MSCRQGRIAWLVLALTVAAPTSASAPPGAQAYLAAAAQFVQLAGGKPGDEHVPTLAEPGVAALLHTLSDAKATLGNQHYGADDMNALMPVCNKATEVIMRYELAGAVHLKAQVQAGTPVPELARQMAALMGQNTLKYQDEAMPVMAFSARCMAAALPALTAFSASLKPAEVTDVRRAGLKQLRLGIVQLVTGSVRSAAEPKMHPANQRLLLEAVADGAEVYAEALSLDERAAVGKAAKALRESVPEALRGQVDRLVGAMGREDCTGLCAY